MRYVALFALGMLFGLAFRAAVDWLNDRFGRWR